MKCDPYEEKELHMTAPIDTSAMEEEFYKRMRKFEVLFPDNVPLNKRFFNDFCA